MATAPLRLGISSCLAGHKVRYDGNHQRDAYLCDILGQHFELLPVCPEAAIGMGIPRPPIRLVGEAHAPRAVGVKDPALDVSTKLRQYGRRMGRELQDISGYVFKSKSPSCGMERVKLFAENGHSLPGKGVGLYAQAIMEAQPLLPVEEEGRLNDPYLRDNFLERVFAYHRWQQACQPRITPARLVAFHSAHKYSLMAHGPEHYRALGQLVAKAGKGPIKARADEYIHGFMRALQYRATVKRHSNVLQHLMGYLKKALDPIDKQELLDAIHGYREGRIPRIVAVTLLRHHFMKHPDQYIKQQVYLYPSSTESLLRLF